MPTLHALNDGFAWADHHDPFRFITDEQARAYDEQGYFVVEDAVDSETVNMVTAEIDPVEAEVEALLGVVCLDEAPDAVPVPARAGSIVVLSSLTPHSTGPNRTDEVRKSYIVQYAPDGAHTLDERGRVTSTCDDPDRQFLVT